MKIAMLKTGETLKEQVLKIMEEVGELAESINMADINEWGEMNDVDREEVQSEINDVIQACFTLHFKLEDWYFVCGSWDRHNAKLKERMEQGRIKILETNEM